LTQHSGFPEPLVAIKAALTSRRLKEKCGSGLHRAQIGAEREREPYRETAMPEAALPSRMAYGQAVVERGISQGDRLGEISLARLTTPDEVVAFWREAGPERWFSTDETFDQTCRDCFMSTYEAAARGDLGDWELTPNGALAVVLLLDQFPRNMFRGTRRAYATDPGALMTADRAIERGYDKQVDLTLRRFLYLPFMHSEELRDQQRSVALHEALGETDSLEWARHHQEIIARFGRFPHRNATLGRKSTADEERFLQESEFRG
jgi:uncharacterized protein (DUF924 family)